MSESGYGDLPSLRSREGMGVSMFFRQYNMIIIIENRNSLILIIFANNKKNDKR